MTKLKYAALLLLVLSLGACYEDEGLALQPGAVPTVSNVVNGFFNLADVANAYSAFDVNYRGADVSSIDVFISLNGGNPVSYGSISSFPGTVEATAVQAASAVGTTTDALELGDAFVFSFEVKTADGRTLRNAVTVTVPMSCLSSLEGMYSVTTTYGYHDFLPTYSSNTMTMELQKVGEGQYLISDFSGGLYSSGPYSTAYGTGGVAATIVDICNQISWSGVNDGYGAVISNGVNEVDPETGIITINWYCEGYGENGESIYTPL